MEIDRLSSKYHGDMADSYDALREGTPQWESEQKIVVDLLSVFGPETTVLDVPVGTGRFIPSYAASTFAVTGLDASSSMLAKSRAKAESCGLDVALHEGSIDALDFPDGAFDLVVCLRFMDWVDGDFLSRAFDELARVTKGAIIVSIPTYTPASEIGLLSVSGFVRFLKQWKFRFFKLRTRSDAVVHKKSHVLGVLDRLGLEIADQFRVDEPSSDVWRRGEDRDIYLLRKRV